MAKTLTKRDLVNKISAETNFTQIEVFDIVQRPWTLSPAPLLKATVW